MTKILLNQWEYSVVGNDVSLLAHAQKLNLVQEVPGNPIVQIDMFQVLKYYKTCICIRIYSFRRWRLSIMCFCLMWQFDKTPLIVTYIYLKSS